MTLIPEFRERLDTAEISLDAVRRLERAYRKNRRISSSQFKSVAAMRGGVNLMIYNSIEWVIRQKFSNMRKAIQAEGVPFASAKDFWQYDYMKCAFLEKMQNGTNHGNLLGAIVPRANALLSWDEDRLIDMPTTGNFGQESAIYLKERLPLNWNFPANTGGGIDLEFIRNNRNDLAHGLDSFENVGNTTDSDALHDSLRRVRQFMISMIEALERYQADRLFIR